MTALSGWEASWASPSGSRGGGGEGLAEAAGSASVNLIQDVVQALIVSAANPAMMTSVIAGGPILVEASDTSSIIGAAGGLGVSVSGTAVGIAVTYNLIQNTISAYTEDADVRSKNGGAITFDADSSPAIIGVAAGLSAGGGESIAGAGSIAVNSIAGNVDAHAAANADVETAGDITIVAAQSAPMVSVAGGVAVSGRHGGAAGRDLVQLHRRQQATCSTPTPSIIRAPPVGSSTFDDDESAVSSSNHTITFPGQTNDGFITGEAVVYHNADPGTQGIGGLIDGTTYYVIVKGPNQIQLASSADALAGTARAIDNTGTTSHDVTLTAPASGRHGVHRQRHGDLDGRLDLHRRRACQAGHAAGDPGPRRHAALRQAGRAGHDRDV